MEHEFHRRAGEAPVFDLLAALLLCTAAVLLNAHVVRIADRSGARRAHMEQA